MFLCSCATHSPDAESPAKNFNKICMEGSGKGRIELVNAKYTFEFEAQINKQTNRYELALAFPIVGEKKISLSLDPKEAAKEINHSQVLHLIDEKLGDRYNKAQVLNAMEEFFVLTSEFLYYRSKDKFPTSYSAHFSNEHFIMERPHGQFRFEIDSFAEDKGFFRRIYLKVYPLTPANSASLFTMFLVPETCDH